MYQVTDEQIEDILDAAGYGINYWCIGAVIDSEARTYTVETDPDLTDDEAPATLTYDKLLETAFRIAGRQYEVNDGIREYFTEWLEALEADDEDSQWAGGFIDADAGDVLIQIAIHGEIVYG
jgi:hypothetical protein